MSVLGRRIDTQRSPVDSFVGDFTKRLADRARARTNRNCRGGGCAALLVEERKKMDAVEIESRGADIESIGSRESWMTSSWSTSELEVKLIKIIKIWLTYWYRGPE